MLPKINPTTTQAWLLLKKHYDEEMSHTQIKNLFEKDKERFNKFSLWFNDILFDYSKNIITEKTLNILLNLAEDCKVKEAIEAMFSGEIINETEGRSVLHTALRNFSGKPVYSEGKDVMPDVHRVQKQMKDFAEKFIQENGKDITVKK